MANKKKALISPGQNQTYLTIFTTAAITGLTSNKNITQDPEHIAERALKIALATCKQLETIENILKDGQE
jgi:hypothetical protein